MNLRQIVSGGQTGVDRAALDAALEAGLPIGGWCPRGRLAEDGPIPERYPLRETSSADYSERTCWNVRDSDATLIVNRGALDGGTLLTLHYARSVLGRPVLVHQLETGLDLSLAAAWIEEHSVEILNLAGPRESKRAGIYAEAAAFLRHLFSQQRQTTNPDS